MAFPKPSNFTQLPLENIHDMGIKDLETLDDLNVKEGFTKDDAQEWMQYSFSMLAKPFVNFTDICNMWTEWLSSWFSEDEEEQSVIERNIKGMFTVLISFYVTYNWYYMMFYEKRPQRIDITMSTIANNHPIVHLFLKYNLVAVSCLDYLLMELVPNATDKLFVLFPTVKYPLLFICLYVLIWYCVYTYGEYTINRIINASQLHFDEFSGLFIAFMVLYGMSSAIFNVSWIDMALRKIQYMYLGVPTLLLFIIRIVLFSIPFVFLSTLTTCLYIVFISLFAIPYYGSMDFRKHFMEIKASFSKDFSSEETYDTWWIVSNLKFLLKFPINFILKYLVQIVVVATLVHAIQDYATHLDSTSMVQHLMISFSALIILAIVSYEIYVFYRHSVDTRIYPTNIQKHTKPTKTKIETTQPVEIEPKIETTQPVEIKPKIETTQPVETKTNIIEPKLNTELEVVPPNVQNPTQTDSPHIMEETKPNIATNFRNTIQKAFDLKTGTMQKTNVAKNKASQFAANTASKVGNVASKVLSKFGPLGKAASAMLA